MPMADDRELDVVVFGATGFVGRLLAQYLAAHAPPEARIGLAGRSIDRLTDIRGQLPGPAATWPLLVADSGDPKSLARLAATTRVVATTVGPYRPRGIDLVAACLNAETDYCDLTGEPLFIRESIDRFHDEAARKGVRIVHCCGFDSIPSDLSVMLLHQQAHADAAGDLQDTTLVVKGLKGSLSLGHWIGPFIMAGINTRVVRRSNALQGWTYGRQFRYREVTDFGAGVAGAVGASAMAAGLGTIEALAGFGPARAILNRLVPKPGEGPDEKARNAGFFKIEVRTRTSSGARYRANVEAQGDPGYAATSVILGEASLCLALDRERLPQRGGVLTPATAMGLTLVDRLRAAGQTIAVERFDS